MENIVFDLYIYIYIAKFYINTFPTRCNTKQSIYYSASFGCQPHPSSGVHKTVTTASGTVQLPPSNVANFATMEGGSCTVPEAVVTVLCTPDDGCG